MAECPLDTVRLRGSVWEPCAGQGALPKVLADGGYRVVATDLVAYDECVFPVAAGIDVLDAPLPPGVRAIVTNPSYSRLLLPQLVDHWLGLLESVGASCAFSCASSGARARAGRC